MRLLFVIDPFEQLKPAKDSSLAMMREASQRGHQLWVAQLQDLLLQQDQLSIQASELKFTAPHNSQAQHTGQFSQLGLAELMPATAFDVILMRKDPPFDNEYLYATHLLELAQLEGVKVVNHPAMLRDWNEKLAVAHFADLAPPFMVSKSAQMIRQFLQQQQDIVLKPLDGMGGSSVFRLSQQDVNLSVIIETMTQHGTRSVMAQRYLPEIVQGDKRILLIDGEAAPYCLARIPQAGETRANLAAGGRGEARPLTERDRQIAQRVGAYAKQQGLLLVGLDVIGDYLTEINVTSPTCMVEIAAQTDCNPAAMMVNALERLCG